MKGGKEGLRERGDRASDGGVSGRGKGKGGGEGGGG